MLFVLRHSQQPTQNQRELRLWFFRNGLLHCELGDRVVLDTVAQTVTVSKMVPVAGQDGHDFPEFVLDADDQPVTVTEVVHLTTVPLPWMLTMTGAWSPTELGAAPFAAASR